MTKIGLKITVISAVCSMLSAAVWAQADSTVGSSESQIQRSWSTKRLSATGRIPDQVIRASQLVGAQVNDTSGHRVGQIKDTVINPTTGRIDFALLSLEENASAASTPAGESTKDRLMPIPWALLRPSESSSQYANSSDHPTFSMNADQAKVKNAPVVNWSDLNQSQWRQRIFAYYGVTPQPSMGAAESPQGQTQGHGIHQTQPPNPDNPPSP